MTPEAWLTELDRALPGDVPPLDPPLREALLELARVAAHASQRWTAPVTTFQAGLALATVPAAEREQVVRRLVADLGDDAPER